MLKNVSSTTRLFLQHEHIADPFSITVETKIFIETA